MRNIASAFDEWNRKTLRQLCDRGQQKASLSVALQDLINLARQRLNAIEQVEAANDMLNQFLEQVRLWPGDGPLLAVLRLVFKECGRKHREGENDNWFGSKCEIHRFRDRERQSVVCG